MKKKLIAMLTLLCICIASLASAAMVYADGFTVPDDYNVTSGIIIDRHEAGGIITASNIAQNQIVEMKMGGAVLNATEHKYMHIKAKVANGLYRIKFNYQVVDASTATLYSRLIDTSEGKQSDVGVVVDENGVFEYHAETPADLLGVELEKFAFQMYVSGDTNATIDFLGVVFNTEENYSDFAEPYVSSHTHDWATNLTQGASTHWYACSGCSEKGEETAHDYTNGSCVCGKEQLGELSFGIMTIDDTSVATLEKEVAGGTGKITFNEAGVASVSIPVSNFDVSKHHWLSVMMALDEGVTVEAYVDDTYICTDLLTAWNAKKHLETYPNFVIANVDASPYIPALSSVSTLKLTITASAAATVEIMDITFTADGVHGFEIPHETDDKWSYNDNYHWHACLSSGCEDVEDYAAHNYVNNVCECGKIEPGVMYIHDIVVPDSTAQTYVKDATTGAQSITYSASPEYNTFDANVVNYDSEKSILVVEVTLTADTRIGFSIGGIDWSVGHALYNEGKHTIKLDMTNSAYTTSENFTISIYLDATNITVAEEKTVTFHSIRFEEPAPEPEGMHIGTPSATAMTCTEDELGWAVSWEYSGWSSVTFPVKNFEAGYDILVVRMSGVAGMNLGLRILWQDENGAEKHDDIRNHWSDEGLVETTGDMELVFFMKAFGIENEIITGFTLYFDPPTNNYTPNEGEQNATIYSTEFLKSSEQDFDDLTITANNKTADFTGEPIALDATNDQDVALIVEYEIVSYDEEGNESRSWTASAPSKAGTYNVRVIFMGSLTYDYTVVTSTLTINKVKATIAEGDITIDPETRVITIAEGVIASFDDEFEVEIEDGAEIAYGSVIYYYRPADDNHTESDVLSLTFTKPVDEDSSSSNNDSSSTVDSGNQEQPPKKNSCFTSVATMGSEISIALMGAIALFIRRKRR